MSDVSTAEFGHALTSTPHGVLRSGIPRPSRPPVTATNTGEVMRGAARDPTGLQDPPGPPTPRSHRENAPEGPGSPMHREPGISGTRVYPGPPSTLSRRCTKQKGRAMAFTSVCEFEHPSSSSRDPHRADPDGRGGPTNKVRFRDKIWGRSRALAHGLNWRHSHSVSFPSSHCSRLAHRPGVRNEAGAVQEPLGFSPPLSALRARLGGL